MIRLHIFFIYRCALRAGQPLFFFFNNFFSLLLQYPNNYYFSFPVLKYLLCQLLKFISKHTCSIISAFRLLVFQGSTHTCIQLCLCMCVCVVTCTCTLFKQEFFPQNNFHHFSPGLLASTLPLIWRCCFSWLCTRGHSFQMLQLFAISQLFIHFPYNFFPLWIPPYFSSIF